MPLKAPWGMIKKNVFSMISEATGTGKRPGLPWLFPRALLFYPGRILLNL